MASIFELTALEINVCYTGSLLPRADNAGALASSVAPNHDRVALISDQIASVNQDLGAVAWESIVIPPTPAPVVPKVVDVSRFRKAYPHRQQQPKRVTIGRRGS